jgi:hypothetical protein
MKITPAVEAVARALAKSSNETQWENYFPAARAAIRAHLEAIRGLPDDLVQRVAERCDVPWPGYVRDGYTAIIDHMLAEVTS